jgi:hypothetical protein
MLNDKRKPSVDPRGGVQTLPNACFLPWGKCKLQLSKMYDVSHSCKRPLGHKLRHECLCGVTKLMEGWVDPRREKE